MRSTTSRILAGVAIIGLLGACSYAATATQTDVKKSTSMVRVDIYNGDAVENADALMGHGSGVYIGNDIVITAAHVARGHDKVMLVSDGSEQVAEVLWVNDKFDVAALRPAEPERYTAADLSCDTPMRGTAVVAAGSPLYEDNIYSPGVVIGDKRTSGNWESVIVTNASMAQGMSGGPAYDAAGSVVGINVGVMTTMVSEDPFHPDGSLTGLSYVVPGSTICELLGRV
jgi:serine protease Do